MLKSMNAVLSRLVQALRHGATRFSMAVVLVCALVPASAWGQAATPAPQPNLKQFPAPWIGMAFMFLMTAVVVAISLMPSKRSHQD
jgi:hypothetical protein